jgi:hypothetical protein
MRKLQKVKPLEVLLLYRGPFVLISSFETTTSQRSNGYVAMTTTPQFYEHYLLDLDAGSPPPPTDEAAMPKG